MKLTQQIFKFIIVFTLILLFCLSSLMLKLFYWNRWVLAKKRSHLLMRYCRLGLKVMGVQLTMDKRIDASMENRLIVCNHLSYMDILLLSSVVPTSFVTSMEIKNDPFLGRLSELASCLYVERRSRKNLSNEISDITNALKNGLNVTIFPEATSTNGEQVLRFRRPLYNSALHSQKRTLPLCINYRKLNDQLITKQNRDSIFWYDKMAFFPHLWNFLSLSSIEVSISVLDEVSYSQDLDAADIAEQTHKMVSERFIPCTI